jgi:Resolvase, N terminal domain
MLILEHLKARGAHFRSLSDPIDTGSPQGMLSLQVLGAVSEFERRLASERTKAGIKSAHARGRMSGNPRLRARLPEAIHAVRAKNNDAYINNLLADMSKWLPVVQRMRPQHSWTKVANVINLTARRKWSRKTLRHAVKRLVLEGIAQRELLEPAPRSTDDQLLVLVAGIKAAAPERTLQQIAAQLEDMSKTRPNGSKRWYPASVRSLLLQAERRGILPKVAA